MANNLELLNQYRANKDKEREKYLSPSSNLAQLQEYRISRDFDSLSGTISNAYNGWQDKKTMDSTKSKLSSAQRTLSNYYNDYQNLIDSEKRDYYKSLLGSYNRALTDWNTMSDMYSNYVNASAYNRAKKNAQYDEKWSGSSYDAVKNAYNSETIDADEKNYLRQFTKYGTLADFDAALNDRKMHDFDKKSIKNARSNFATMNAFEEYRDIMNRPDFAEKSKLSDKDANTLKLIENNVGGGVTVDPKAINGKRTIGLTQITNDDIRSVGQYLYNTDKNAYEDFMRKIDVQASAEKNQIEADKWTDWTNKNPLTGLVGTVVNTVGRPLASVGATLEAGEQLTNINNLYNAIKNRDIEEIKYNPFSGAAGDIRKINQSQQALAGSVEDAFGPTLGGLAKLGYNAGTEGITSRIGQLTTGGLYNFVMGGGVLAQTYGDALLSGMGKAQALGKAAMAGTIETATEAIGMEGAFKWIPDSTWWRNMLKQGFAEGAEEVVGNVANLVYDNLVNGKDSELRTEIKRYMDRGYSKEVAVKMAATKFALETMEEAATAGLSAGISGGVSAVRTSQTGQNVDFGKLGEAVAKFNEDSDVRKAYNKVAQTYGDNVPNWNKGFVFQQAYNETAKADTLGKLIDEAGDRSEAEQHRLIDRYGDEYAQYAKPYQAVREAYVQPTNQPVQNVQKAPEQPAVPFNVRNDNYTYADDVDYITRQAKKEYGGEVAKIFEDNLVGDADTYKANFDVIKWNVDNGFGLENALNSIGNTMAHSKAADIYEQLSAERGKRSQAIREAHDTVRSTWDRKLRNGTFDESQMPDRLRGSDVEKVEFAKDLAVLGYDTGVFKDYKTKDAGFVQVKDGKIWLNLAARYSRKDKATLEEFFSTAEHEMLHFDRVMLGEEWNDFRDEVHKAMGDEMWKDLVAKKMQGIDEENLEKKFDIAQEEVVADYVRKFSSVDAFDEFLSKIDENKVEKFFKAIKESIAKFFRDVAAKLQGYEREDAISLGKDIESNIKKKLDEMRVRALEMRQVQLQNQELGEKGMDNSESEQDNEVRRATIKPTVPNAVRVDELYDNVPKEFMGAWFNMYDLLYPGEFKIARDEIEKKVAKCIKNKEPLTFKGSVNSANHYFIFENYNEKDFRVFEIINIESPNVKYMIGVKYNGRKDEDISRIVGGIRNDREIFPNDTNNNDIKRSADKDATGISGKATGNRTGSDGYSVQSEEVRRAIIADGEEIKQKFGEGNNADFRFSKILDDTELTPLSEALGNIKQLEKRVTTLDEDVKRLRELYRLQGEVTKGKVFKPNQIRNVVKSIKSIANSEIEDDYLAGEINNLYNNLVNQLGRDFTEGEPDTTDIVDMCKDLAREILDKNKGEKVIFPEFKEAFKQIRDTRIRLSEEEVAAMRELYGNNWHQQTFGRFKFVKDGIPLKQAINQWRRSFPWAVDEILESKNPSAKEMVDALGDIYDLVRDSSEMISYYIEETDVQKVAEELYNKFWTVSTLETVADKYDKQIKELRAKHRDAMNELRETSEKDLRQLRADKNAVIKAVRERGEEKLKEYKAYRKAMETARRDNAQKKAYVDRITDTAETLINWFNTNQKDKKILDIHKEAVADFLSSIDFSSKTSLGMRGEQRETVQDRKMTESLRKITEMAEKLKSEDVTIGLSQEEIDRVKSINSLLEDMKGNYVLNQMSVDDLHDLSAFMQMLKKAITDSNDLFYGKQKMKIQDLVLPDNKENILLGQKKSNDAKAFFEWKNSTPIYAFEHLGKGALKVFHEAMDGWDEYAFLTQDIEDFLIGDGKKGKPVGILNRVDYKKWQEDIKEFTVNGKKIQMPVSYIMNLYNIEKREQGRNHLYGLSTAEREEMEAQGREISDNDKGGISILSFDGQDHDQHWDVVTLTPEVVKEITSVLDADQRKVADAMAEFYKVTGQWINETSRRYKGVGLAYEDHYWNLDTVHVKRGGKVLEEDNPSMNGSSLFALLNKSFTKPLNVNANNPVKVGDIFDVFFEHTTDAAKYKALALPALDIYRYANYVGEDADGKEFAMKFSIEKAHGEEAFAYITKFLQDLNGTSEHGRDDKLAKILVKNYKAAQVAANIQTAALQPIAIIRADLKMDKGYLARGVAMDNKKGREEMLKYSGIALWKERGGYDINTQRGLYNKVFGHKTKLGKVGDKVLDIRDNIVETALKPAGWMDTITWAAIWNGCKAEGMDKGLKGDALIDYTKDKFREVVYYTQVVDSTMTRSEKMRDPTMFGQLTTSFLSEPTLTINMLMDAITKYSQDMRKLTNDAMARGMSEKEAKSWARKQSFTKHGQYIGKCISIYLVSAAVESVIRGLFTKYRDLDEDDDKLMQTMWKEFLEQINPMQNLPVFRDVYNEFKGYKTQRTDMAAISNLATATTNWKKILKGDKSVDYKTIYKTMQAISQLTGVPVSSLMRDVKAGYDIIAEQYPSLQK